MNDTDAGVALSAAWHYRSFEVNVNLTLTTHEADDTCTTTAHLRVNDALSGADDYNLPATDCTVLRLGADGDIVMDAAPTGHDWTHEQLSVNTGREIISLGPVSLADPDTGDPVSITFTIAAPPCGDGTDCDCGVLRRTGGTAHSLSLGRKC